MNEFGAVVLAGGQSRRMGADKARLRIGRQTMLERLLENLSSVVSQVVVMSNTSQNSVLVSTFGENLILARDSKDRQGPLRGIADALPFLRRDLKFVFVLSCDLPYLTSENLESMKSLLAPGTDIVYADNEGILNPVLALYRKEVLASAPGLLEKGHRRPMDLGRGRKTVSVAPPSENPLAYSDANTPEAFEKARKFHGALTWIRRRQK